MGNLKKRPFIFTSISIFFSFLRFSHAQHRLGSQTSNIDIFSAQQSNPAVLAESKLNFGIHLASGSADVLNNYMKWNAPFSYFQFFSGAVPSAYTNPMNGKTIWLGNYAIENSKINPVRGYAQAAVQLPSVYVNHRKSKMGFMVGINNRFQGALTNTSEEFVRHIVKIRPSGIFGSAVTGNKLQVTVGQVNEFFFSVGKTIIDDNDNKIKAGITLKKLSSDLHFNLTGNDLDYAFIFSSLLPLQNDISFSKTVGSVTSVDNSFLSNKKSVASQLLVPFGAGNGISLDFGVIFEKKDEVFVKYNDRNKYKTDYLYKIGLSVTDIGYLKFKQTETRKAEINETSTVIYNAGDLGNVQSTSDVFVYISNKYGLNPADFTTNLAYSMPMQVRFFMDVKVVERIFISSFVHQNILSTSRNAFLGYSVLGVVPRMETKWYEVSLPILLQNNYKNLTIGLAGRLGGLTLGTNNLLGFFSSSKSKGVSAYFSLFVPIFPKSNSIKNECYYPSDKPAKRRKKILSLRKR